MSPPPWPLIRTLIAAAGIGFTGAALGSACLDYAGEGFGTCPTTSSATSDAGLGSGAGNGAAATPAAGSASFGDSPGSGSSTPVADCGTASTTVDSGEPVGSGVGSAAP